jgi:hypothetical protein
VEGFSLWLSNTKLPRSKKLLLPAVKLAGVHAVLIAQIGDGLFVHQMGFEDGDLFFGRKAAPAGFVLLLGHISSVLD